MSAAGCRASCGLLLALFVLLALGGCGARKSPPGATARRPLLNEKVVVLWVDWAAAEDSLSSRQIATAFCRDAREAGVTHLALEARDWAGRAILQADGSAYLPEQQLRAAAKETGLRLGAVLPCFVPPADAPADLLSHQARWSEDGWLIEPVSPPRLSPVHRHNRDRELDLLTELARDPAIEFVLLSGVGFGDAHADLGPDARLRFEAAAGATVLQWPKEVIGSRPPDYPLGAEGRGPLWEAWSLWRADIMKRFLLSVHETLMIASPPGQVPWLAVMVDAPYPMHQREGLNWAAPGLSASRDFPWLPASYDNTAGGHLADAVAIGLWEPSLLRQADAEREGYAWWASVEGASLAARRVSAAGTRIWGAIPVSGTSAWANAARTAGRLNGGLVLIGASHFLDNPADWELLRLALQ